MARKRATTTRRRTTARRTGRRSAPKTSLLTVGGVGLSLLQAYRLYNKYSVDYNRGSHEAMELLVGYDRRGPKWGTWKELLSRWTVPALAGKAAHEIAGNTRGAFGSGIGLKLNRTFKMGKYNL